MNRDQMMQYQREEALEVLDENAAVANSTLLLVETATRKKSKGEAETQLNKLFLARLDVRSRIAELNRNRAKLQARKIDVQEKISNLSEFDMKLMRKEEELCRTLAES